MPRPHNEERGRRKSNTEKNILMARKAVKSASKQLNVLNVWVYGRTTATSATKDRKMWRVMISINLEQKKNQHIKEEVCIAHRCFSSF